MFQTLRRRLYCLVFQTLLALDFIWASPSHATPSSRAPCRHGDPSQPAAVTRFLLLVSLASLLAAGDEPRLEPLLQRVDLAASASCTVAIRVHAGADGLVTAVVTDCACLRLLTPLPLRLAADGTGVLELRASGVRPGVELVQVATTSGIIQAHVQIAGPGAGEGLAALRTCLAEAVRERRTLLAVVHDLRGTVRNCGCSQGSLGGADLLAGLPALAAELAPGLSARWVLTGEVDGAATGLGQALAGHGWTVSDPGVAVADDPLPLLDRSDLQVVVTTGSATVQHARILRPALGQGLAVDILLLDGAGRVRSRTVVPVDRTLRAVHGLAAQFRDGLTRQIDPAISPSQSCVVCHATAGAAWATSRHARAFDSLKPDDRTDTCISCHVTPVTAKVVAPAVACQSCHQGGEAHAASQGKLRTAGTADCRSCHDAKHHPTFRRELAWPKILHGREPATKP